jgi:hypothetical protein
MIGTLWQTTKGFITQLASAVKEEIPAFSEIGAMFSEGGKFRTAGLGGISLLANRNLTLKQKILPGTGILIAGGTAFFAIAALFTGTPDWVRTLLYSAIVGGVASGAFDAASYIEDFFERRNLRYEFMSEAQLTAEINRTSFRETSKNTLKEYAFAQSQLLMTLYQIRCHLKTSKALSDNRKQKLINTVNDCIEVVSQDLPFPFDKLQKVTIYVPVLTAPIQAFTVKMHRYEFAKNSFKRAPITKTLRHQIEGYRLTQNKICSQPLPQHIKADLVKLLSQETINESQFKKLLEQIAEHYIKIVSKSPFATPHVNFDLDRNNLLKKVEADFAKTELGKDIVAVRVKIHEDIQEIKSNLTGELQRTPEQKQRIAAFDAMYLPVLDLIHQAYRLKYLKSAAPIHFSNVATDVMMGLTHFMQTRATSTTLSRALPWVGNALPFISTASRFYLSFKQTRWNNQLKNELDAMKTLVAHEQGTGSSHQQCLLRN